MSDRWNFLVGAPCLSPRLSDNPFLTVSSPQEHSDADTRGATLVHTVPRECTCTHMYTCTVRPPVQWLGALAKFLNPPPAFWVGGSRLPENNGMD